MLYSVATKLNIIHFLVKNELKQTLNQSHTKIITMFKKGLHEIALLNKQPDFFTKAYACFITF